MSQKSEELKRKLDTLIELFKRFRDKVKQEEFQYVDKSLFSNINLLISNYDSIKNNFPDDIFEEIGEPLQQMINQAIEQLKLEFGNDIAKDEATTYDLSVIDEHLKNPHLSIDEIDELLDKRKGINS